MRFLQDVLKPPPAEPGADLSASQQWRALAALMVPIFLGGLDTTIANSVGVTMTGLGSTGAQWFVDVYSIALAAFIVVASRIGDRFGRRRGVLVGLALFGLASLGCIVSGETAAAVVFRGVQGAGYALMVSGVVSSIRAVFDDPHDRALAYGWWTVVTSVGAGVGPIAGCLLSEWHGWRAAFAINVPLAVVGMLLVAALVPESRSESRVPFRTADGLLSLACLAFVVGSLQMSGPPLLRVGVFVAGALLGYVFYRRQQTGLAPLIIFGLFRIRVFALSAALIVASYAGYTGLVYFVSNVVGGARAGLGVLVMAAVIAASGLLVTRLPQAWRGWGILVAALVSEAVGYLLMPLSASAVFWAAAAFAGFGVGVVSTLSSAELIGSVELRDAGPAGAVQETSFAIGAAFGVAVVGALLHAEGAGMACGAAALTLFGLAAATAATARRQG